MFLFLDGLVKIRSKKCCMFIWVFVEELMFGLSVLLISTLSDGDEIAFALNKEKKLIQWKIWFYPVLYFMNFNPLPWEMDFEFESTFDACLWCWFWLSTICLYDVVGVHFAFLEVVFFYSSSCIYHSTANRTCCSQQLQTKFFNLLISFWT